MKLVFQHGQGYDCLQWQWRRRPQGTQLQVSVQLGERAWYFPAKPEAVWVEYGGVCILRGFLVSWEWADNHVISMQIEDSALYYRSRELAMSQLIDEQYVLADYVGFSKGDNQPSLWHEQLLGGTRPSWVIPIVDYGRSQDLSFLDLPPAVRLIDLLEYLAESQGAQWVWMPEQLARLEGFYMTRSSGGISAKNLPWPWERVGRVAAFLNWSTDAVAVTLDAGVPSWAQLLPGANLGPRQRWQYTVPTDGTLQIEGQFGVYRAASATGVLFGAWYLTVRTPEGQVLSSLAEPFVVQPDESMSQVLTLDFPDALAGMVIEWAIIGAEGLGTGDQLFAQAFLRYPLASERLTVRDWLGTVSLDRVIQLLENVLQVRWQWRPDGVMLFEEISSPIPSDFPTDKQPIFWPNAEAGIADWSPHGWSMAKRLWYLPELGDVLSWPIPVHDGGIGVLEAPQYGDYPVLLKWEPGAPMVVAHVQEALHLLPVLTWVDDRESSANPVMEGMPFVLQSEGQGCEGMLPHLPGLIGWSSSEKGFPKLVYSQRVSSPI